MATKKAASKTAPTSIVKWDEKFAKYAKEGKEQVKSIQSSGLGIQFGRNSISVGGTPIKGGALEGVLVGSCAFNAWYATAYDTDDKQPPDCYAFSIITDDPEMAPHVECASPQNDLCATCSKNEFGTARVGKGKACGNNLRLGVLLGKDVKDAKSAFAAELATGKVSPTNLKHYAAYVDLLLEEHGRPVWAVITEITSHDDPKTQIRLEFRMVDLIEDEELLEVLEKRHLKVQDALQRPFPKPTEKPAKPARAANSQKFAGKPAAKKTAAKR